MKTITLNKSGPPNRKNEIFELIADLKLNNKQKLIFNRLMMKIYRL